MGKLCRIRLLRPNDISRHQDGVNEKELAALAGDAAHSIAPEIEKGSVRKKKQPKKGKTKKSSKSR
jgi:hypothetical protein